MSSKTSDVYTRANGKKRGYVRKGDGVEAVNTYANTAEARRRVNSKVNKAWERTKGADDN